jgi:hypothetical protein
MEALFIAIAVAFVVLVLAVVVFALFELTPFARKTNEFRDPRTGKRLGESPHLD